MKLINIVKLTSFSLAIASASAMAAPANLQVINNTGLTSYAYVHAVVSPSILGPHSVMSMPWATVVNVCHNTLPPSFASSDPCAFEIYATDDPANPQKIDVGTVTMYLSDGHVGYVENKGLFYGLKIVALSPGQFELDTIA